MHIQVPVEQYMTYPVHSVSPDQDLESVHRKLSGLQISSLAVVDREKLVGVISMTDLLRVGRLKATRHERASLLELPKVPVEHLMTREVVTVAPKDSIASAAKAMADAHVHRVYVQDRHKLAGVLSTLDVMLAIRDKRLNSPISAWMSSPAFTVRASEPISLAVERLEKAHVSGLIVVDDGWPVGLFTQREALESSDRPPSTPVEDVMNTAMLALDVSTPIHRAAAQAAKLRVRRVIAVEHRSIEGILTGIDFARAAT